MGLREWNGDVPGLSGLIDVSPIHNDVLVCARVLVALGSRGTELGHCPVARLSTATVVVDSLSAGGRRDRVSATTTTDAHRLSGLLAKGQVPRGFVGGQNEFVALLVESAGLFGDRVHGTATGGVVDPAVGGEGCVVGGGDGIRCTEVAGYTRVSTAIQAVQSVGVGKVLRLFCVRYLCVQVVGPLLFLFLETVLVLESPPPSNRRGRGFEIVNVDFYVLVLECAGAIGTLAGHRSNSVL